MPPKARPDAVPVPADDSDPVVPVEVAEPAVPVRVVARWVDQQHVFNASQGLIRYGDPFEVTVEQLDQDPRLIPWDDAWIPDGAVMAASRLEG